jgi:hypothetical protein
VENSPFTRIVSISDSLVLTGMAYVDGKPVVTIYDKTNKQSIVVSDEPNLKGWKLVSAQPAEKIDYAQARSPSEAKASASGTPLLSKDDIQTRTRANAVTALQAHLRAEANVSAAATAVPAKKTAKSTNPSLTRPRRQFRDELREKFSDEKFRNAPEEDRRNAVKTIFEKIEKQDKGGK